MEQNLSHSGVECVEVAAYFTGKNKVACREGHSGNHGCGRFVPPALLAARSVKPREPTARLGVGPVVQGTTKVPSSGIRLFRTGRLGVLQYLRTPSVIARNDQHI